MNFNFAIVGIRPSAVVLQNHITAQGFEAMLIQVNGQANYSEYKFQRPLSCAIMKRELSPGEFGCAKGHLESYKQAMKCDWLIVFEDDVLPEIDCAAIVEFLKSRKKKAHLVTFHSDLERKENEYRFFIWQRPYRTHAYAINRKAIQKVLRYQKNILSTADWPVQWDRRIPFYYRHVKSIELSDAPSSIELERIALQRGAWNDFQAFTKKFIITRVVPMPRHAQKIFYFGHRFKIYFLDLYKWDIRFILSALIHAYLDLR